ncbi:MAG TPA: hypothetical protein VM286_02995 [Candidatus Thermoplasmatota archaeon]|nr:hypothetical protein [Candidatus Thermoplasmatota archaeon]
MRSLGMLAAVALLVLAGCFQSPAPRTDYARVQTELETAASPALRLDHDDPAGHSKAALHKGAYNLELVGYSNGVDDSGDPDHIPATAFWNELLVTQTHTYLAAESRSGAYGGFSILDTTDKAHPRVLSHFDAQNAFDIEVSGDETLAFMASQRNSVEQVAAGIQANQDPQSDLPRGIYIVDIADKRAPRLDSFVPLPVNGPHTLTYYRHPNGSEYLLVCTYDLMTDPGTGAITGAVPATQRMVVYLVSPNPLYGQVPGIQTGPRVGLTPVAQYQILDPGYPGLVFPHDSRVAVDPADPAKVYITLAYWDKGLRILDFSDPPAPPAPGGIPDPARTPMLREVGAFTDFSPSAYNNIHLARRLLVAGTPVTITEPEIIDASDETGQITFLDTTDVSRPSRISNWTLPAQDPPLGVRDLDFSPHNFDVWDGKVALAHYHAGLWVIDVHDRENLESPKSVAFYMPSMPRADSPVLQPDVWGVQQQGGYLFVSDEATGLHILRYTGP